MHIKRNCGKACVAENTSSPVAGKRAKRPFSVSYSQNCKFRLFRRVFYVSYLRVYFFFMCVLPVGVVAGTKDFFSDAALDIRVNFLSVFFFFRSSSFCVLLCFNLHSGLPEKCVKRNPNAPYYIPTYHYRCYIFNDRSFYSLCVLRWFSVFFSSFCIALLFVNAFEQCVCV